MLRGSLGWSAGLALWVLTGCAKAPQVHVNELPVRRVVVYRNGVAYFEREGHVDGQDVQFSLRRENVGDFLATLAILEKGGSTVRAASFPVELEEDEEGTRDPGFEATMDAWEGKPPDKRPGLRTVTLELDGTSHDVTVGYLAETPVWRPSYRLVVDGKGKAELQAWGIVQNQSGEDWTDVNVSLVAGAPIAFESDLGEPIVPPRPLVTDSGEIVSAVPEGDMLYEQATAAPAAAPAPAPEEAGGYEFDEDPLADAALNAEKKAAAKAPAGRASGGAAPSASKPGRPSPPVTQAAQLGGVGGVRDTSRLAAVAAQTGSTRYDVPVKVTIPDQSATMVLLTNVTIPGEAVYLFAPDYGVPDSLRHPFRVARFKNESGGLLEKGPIAVFEKGAFLGQGLMSSLPIKASASVPFALIRGIAVQTSHGSEHRGSRLHSIVTGRLMLEIDQAVLTTYHVQNGEQMDVRLLVRHPRNAQGKLWQPPA
ncbi:MAG TPA: DUF4139 domain-containing protein, partial [Polyangiaceae bacterium]|nr:DUF4139 domain-containing protein [Polyangiaceae bacterium]